MIYKLSSLVLFASLTSAFHKGLNFGATLSNGACRSTEDWERAFRTARNLPPQFTSARLFASSDCNTLANAVPAALNTGMKLFIGVWTEDEAHFSAEKQAVMDAIGAHPNWQDWLLAASVGSEDLYRKEAPPATIAQKVYDVRGMLQSVGVTVMVGHVDTWTAWVDPANADVVRAVDFAGSDGYPYWQGATPDQASNIFWTSVNNVRNAVNQIKPDLPVWSTETGWPVKGQNFGAAISSVPNAQAYWRSVGCPSFDQIDSFWYAYSERNANPDFSIVDENDQALYDLSC